MSTLFKFGSVKLNKTDFDEVNWQEVISKCKKKDCLCYCTCFNSRAEEEKSNANLKNLAIFSLLSIVTMPILWTKKEEPFSSGYLFDSIDDNYLGVLKELVPRILDAEMKARISDILWIRKKDPDYATIAVYSYIESSKILENPDDFMSSFIRLNRAVNLAASIGKRSKLFDDTIDYIETIVKRNNGEDKKFHSIYLMELLQEYKKGNFEYYASLSKKIALTAENDHYWWKAKFAWETKAKWHRLSREKDKEREALKYAAETYVKNAEDDIGIKSDYINASGRIEEAIQEYRRVGNEDKRVDELHLLLLEYQSKSTSQMTQIPLFNYSIPIAIINQAREFVMEKATQDAVFALASIVSSPKISKLRDDVEKVVNENPLSDIILGTLVNEAGKQIYKKKSMHSEKPDDKEKATEDEMFKHAKFYHLNFVVGIIEPARQQIIQEHKVQIEDLLPIVSSNLFVPAGRELIYAYGLHAGLIGDFLTSTHLLIPQLENSIRYVLNSNGIITSSLDISGIQNEHGLNNTLIKEKLTEFIPEDIVFDLRGLLIERCGSNLRHRMAHGLIDFQEYESSLEVKYLWWLTLNLCYIWKVFSEPHNER
ncbi:DUF4209 domain-containing protein [Methanosarcina spelaei]|nr:DUF4209 domain-containing protein [Methanosarcina spelaei]